MSRSKEFDPDAALQQAMELFWEHGYEATSLAQLTDRLGIGRASLYATFGDKRELYLQALRRYLETRDPDPLELLSQPGPAQRPGRDPGQPGSACTGPLPARVPAGYPHDR